MITVSVESRQVVPLLRRMCDWNHPKPDRSTPGHAMARWCRLATGLLAVLFPLFGVIPQLASANTPGRMALIVGNANYGGLLWDVPAAPHDVKLIQGALTELGFEQTVLLNSSKAQLDDAVEQLAKRIGAKPPGIPATVLVYFSGRAAPAGGETILLPAGSQRVLQDGGSADAVADGTRAQWIIDRLTQAGAGRVLLLLDASRPVPARLARSGALTTGVAPLVVPSDSRADIFIGASAGPGQEGSENVFGKHSYFSRAFAGALAIPGLAISDAFAVARERVKADTGGRQVPVSSGDGGYILRFVSDWDQLSHGGILAVLRDRSLLDLEVDLKRGDGYAAQFLGLAYWDGVGGAKKDLVVAEKYFREGVDHRIGGAANNLGYLLASTERGTPNPTEAAKWYGIGAELGSTIAMNNLGFLYQQGKGVPKDPRRAEQLYLQAAERGSARGHLNLGWLYLSDELGLKNITLARASHERAIEAGYLPVAVSLSQGLRHGFYGKADSMEADRVLYLAAEQGCATCWTEIGKILSEETNESPEAASRSAQAYRKGAEGGDPVGMLELARRYSSGKGVQKDSHYAYVWFQKSHAAGNPEGTGGLGLLLAKGEDVEKDPERAAALLKQALSLEADPSKRFSIYVPNYWSYGTALAKLHEKGSIRGASPEEAKRLYARYGTGSGDKRFTVPIDCGDRKVPFYIYLVDWERDEPPTEEQAEWLQSQRGCTIPSDVRDSFQKLYKIARENKVKFTDLAVYALGQSKEKDAAAGKVQSP